MGPRASQDLRSPSPIMAPARRFDNPTNKMEIFIQVT